ncbi:uncharacterized protein LOC128196654 [Vigna angularis]|uniref:uncharacterized protein LOC128196654 n=1 Tax=Phaseolus angularis TaxID=3914 RepID=UPI0022B43FD7|nr:uncharacterized protein LOC128196654 [Vigna angularis]
MTTKHLKTNDVWNLPQNERIIVRWNEQHQPIGDGGALLNWFLGSITRNFKAFLICYSTWKKIRKDYKEDIIHNTIQEIALKNKHNRTKQTFAHTGGSKSIARKREEMEKECGNKVSRGEVWIATHKKTNGAYASDEARKIGEQIEAYESTTSSQSKKISNSDSLAHALGIQEHCGRVRGLGLGPCPSKVFGVKVRSHSGSSLAAPFNDEIQTQVSSLTSQVNEMKDMIAFML